jgi:hypothetical protein
MAKPARSLRVEPQTFQVAEHSRWNVIQAIEPEAEHLLVEAGGKVRRNHEDYVYEEYWDCPWPTLMVVWPVSTHSVYLVPTTQEDGVIIFMALLLPVLREELHLTYDYRLFSPFGSFEEFFTLRVAQVRIFAEETGVLALRRWEK